MTAPPNDLTVLTEDPIVDEVHAQRDAIAASLGYDIDALFQRLKQVEDAERNAGRVILPLPSGTPGAAA